MSTGSPTAHSAFGLRCPGGTQAGGRGKGLVQEEASQGGAKTWAWRPSPLQADTPDLQRGRGRVSGGDGPVAGLGLTATPGSRWPLGLSLSLCDQETEGRCRPFGRVWGGCRCGLAQLLRTRRLADLLACVVGPQHLCWHRSPAAARTAVAGSVPPPPQWLAPCPSSPRLPAPLGSRGSP